MQYDFVSVKATRKYDIIDFQSGRCDLCKRAFTGVFTLVPEHKLHNFDNIFLCNSCITKCKLDISDEVLESLGIHKDSVLR